MVVHLPFLTFSTPVDRLEQVVRLHLNRAVQLALLVRP
jgi:hypothetical protein